MNITRSEFIFVMEKLSAFKLPDSNLKENETAVFNLNDIIFAHIKANYVIIKEEREIPKKVFLAAKKYANKKHKDFSNFHGENIYSLYGLVCLMVFYMRKSYGKKYNEDLIDLIIDETINEVIKKSNFLQDEKIIPVRKSKIQNKIVELRKQLDRYDQLINIFQCGNLKFNEPSKYLKKISMMVNFDDTKCSLAAECEEASLEYFFESVDECKEISYSGKIKGVLSEDDNEKNLWIIHKYKEVISDGSEIMIISYENTNYKRYLCSLDLSTGEIIINKKRKDVTEQQISNFSNYVKKISDVIEDKIISEIVKKVY